MEVLLIRSAPIVQREIRVRKPSAHGYPPRSHEYGPGAPRASHRLNSDGDIHFRGLRSADDMAGFYRGIDELAGTQVDCYCYCMADSGRRTRSCCWARPIPSPGTAATGVPASAGAWITRGRRCGRGSSR